MNWITDRKPYLEELQPIFKRENYVIYGGMFIVWDGEKVRFEQFVKPPKSNYKEYYEGYFKSENIKAWMPIPIPPVEVKQYDPIISE